MAIPTLSGSYIDETYHRLVQYSGSQFADGDGNLISFGGGPGGAINTVQINKDGTNFTGSANLIFENNTLTLTGSLNITGSTTQTGNNTLIGNTLLSGSVTISGSIPGTATNINIYGDTSVNGAIKFLPISENIDTSVSASYIYVSGSTNDLYFSQNGSGYNNVTRLRWLEGNLYTGLLHGGLITTQSSTVYQVSSGSGVIVNLNASIANDPFPTIQFLVWTNLTASIASLSASYDQQFVAISSSGQIYAQGTPFTDGQFDTLINIGLVLHANHTSINGVKTQPTVAYGWKQRSSVFQQAFGPLKISGFAVSVSGSSARSIVVGSGTAYQDGAYYTQDPDNPAYVIDSGTNISKIWRYYQSGSEWKYDTNGGAGYTVIDPELYNPGGLGTLNTVGTGNYSLQRVYWFPNSVSKAIVVYYGNARYGTLALAVAGAASEQFTEAPNTLVNAIYLGTYAIKGGTNTTLQNPSHFTWLPGGLFRSSGTGGGSGGGGGTPGGEYGEIQYNNVGTFDGVPSLTYDGTTLRATGSFSGLLQGTASYADNGGVTSIIAGNGISVNQAKGDITITSIAASYNTATGSYGSFYDTSSQSNPVANVARSMSFNSTDISNGVSISGSTNPYNTCVKMTNAGVYDVQFSAQFDRTSTGTDIVYIWLRKNGVDIPQTNTSIVLTGAEAANPTVAAWNWFVNANAGDYYQLMWSSGDTNVEIKASTPAYGPAIPSIILTANRVDTFLSNTGSFTGSFTGSLRGTAATASYVNPLIQNVIITGSLTVSGSATSITGPFTVQNSISTNDSTKKFGQIGGGNNYFEVEADYWLATIIGGNQTGIFINTQNRTYLFGDRVNNNTHILIDDIAQTINVTGSTTFNGSVTSNGGFTGSFAEKMFTTTLGNTDPLDVNITTDITITDVGTYIISSINIATTGYIYFPDPSLYVGQTIRIQNRTNRTAGIATNGNEPIDISSSAITTINSYTTKTFIAGERTTGAYSWMEI